MSFIENSRDCPSCGGGHKSKPFCIYEDGYFCFSCGIGKRGDRGFTPHQTELKSTLFGLSRERKTNFNDFSLLSKAWLVKYYVTEQHVKEHSIFEINEYDKIWLVMPTIQNDEIVFYQKRCINERGFVSSGPKVSALSVQNSDTVVLVEDFISYCRVSKFIDCCCLFGTKLSHKDADYISKNYSRINVWLDNDYTKTENSGQIASKKICKALEYNIYLKNVKRGFTISDSRIANICTEKDPKEYSDTEIKQILGV